MAQLERGLKQWQEISELQNDLITKFGEVPRDSKLWGEKLHRLTNENYIDMLTVMVKLIETHPELFQDYQIRAFERAAEIIREQGSEHPRVLDTKSYKKDCWRLVMCLREVWNTVNKDSAYSSVNV